MLCLAPALGLEGLSDDAVMSAAEFLGLGITEALSEGGRALHVREEDGDKAGRGGLRCGLLALAQELVDGGRDRLRVAQVRRQ